MFVVLSIDCGVQSGRSVHSNSLPVQLTTMQVLIMRRPHCWAAGSYLCATCSGPAVWRHAEVKLEPRKLRSTPWTWPPLGAPNGRAKCCGRSKTTGHFIGRRAEPTDETKQTRMMANLKSLCLCLFMFSLNCRQEVAGKSTRRLLAPFGCSFWPLIEPNVCILITAELWVLLVTVSSFDITWRGRFVCVCVSGRQYK